MGHTMVPRPSFMGMQHRIAETAGSKSGAERGELTCQPGGISEGGTSHDEVALMETGQEERGDFPGLEMHAFPIPAGAASHFVFITSTVSPATSLAPLACQA